MWVFIYLRKVHVISDKNVIIPVSGVSSVCELCLIP